MRPTPEFTPASLWRAFFVFAGLTAAAFAAVPGAPPTELAQTRKPTPQEAAQLVQQVRQAGIPGEFYFEFELRSLPRRGAATTFKGQLWSSRNDQGVITRVELVDGAGATHRLLIQNGAKPAVWRLDHGRAAAVAGEALFEPLIPGVEVSAFDLQMPFLYWSDLSVEKLTRILGRPAWSFLFRPPSGFAPKADIAGVRAYLDTQFNAIMQTEIIGRSNRPVKTFSLLSLKRVGEQPVPKEADFRNESTRDKTRLIVTAVALKLNLPPEMFAPAGLAQPARAPAADALVRFEP